MMERCPSCGFPVDPVVGCRKAGQPRFALGWRHVSRGNYVMVDQDQRLAWFTGQDYLWRHEPGFDPTTATTKTQMEVSL